MKFLRRMPLFLLALLTLTSLALSSCSATKAFSDEMRCDELMDAVVDRIPVNFGYESFDKEHLRYYFEDDALFDDQCLRYSAVSEDINEIGIFHSPDEPSAKQLALLCEEYLQELREEKSAFIASYAAEELPKLENGEVRRFGNYTVYAILSDDDRALAFAIIEQALLPSK